MYNDATEGKEKLSQDRWNRFLEAQGDEKKSSPVPEKPSDFAKHLHVLCRPHPTLIQPSFNPHPTLLLHVLCRACE